LIKALKASQRKIIVFLFAVFIQVIILKSFMYVAESGTNGFTSILQYIYWAIVTIATIGYGDMVPMTIIDFAVACVIMITGFAIIAVPTGIVIVEIFKARRKDVIRECPECAIVGHDSDTNFCKYCGSKL